MSRYPTGRSRGAPSGNCNALKNGRRSRTAIRHRRLRGRLLRQLAAARRLLIALGLTP